jgi:ketosteroid isomerase-like protein
MNRIALALVLAAASPALLAVPAAAVEARATSPQRVADELLAADRGFAAAAAGTDTATAIAAMFHDDVIMPLPDATFAHGREAAVAALRANPFNTASRAEWAPVRAGISADGRHGFTFGYMTIRGADGAARHAKYLTYWVRTPAGWRAAAYKRAIRPEGAVPTAMLAPALPARIVRPARNPDRSLREALRAAEQAFSDEAQRIGLGPAFARNGSADAMNMGPGPAFRIGAAAIGGEMPQAGSEVSWSAEDAIVAASGDLGVTWGYIRPNGPVTEGRPARFPFFTVWRRVAPDAPWRYVAE